MQREIIFLVKFFVIFGILEALIFYSDMSFIQNPIAGFEAGLLGLGHEGNSILLDGQSFNIASSCTGLVSSAVLAAIIFSLRKPELGKKLGIFAIGAAALLLLNLVRIYIVLLFGIYYGAQLAEAMHVVSWLTTSAAIILLWYYLTKRLYKIRDFAGFM